MPIEKLTRWFSFDFHSRKKRNVDKKIHTKTGIQPLSLGQLNPVNQIVRIRPISYWRSSGTSSIKSNPRSSDPNTRVPELQLLRVHFHFPHAQFNILSDGDSFPVLTDTISVASIDHFISCLCIFLDIFWFSFALFLSSLLSVGRYSTGSYLGCDRSYWFLSFCLLYLGEFWSLF